MVDKMDLAKVTTIDFEAARQALEGLKSTKLEVWWLEDELTQKTFRIKVAFFAIAGGSEEGFE